ncbi:MAG: response regulator [Candidatus Omnitrophica bacterium]|nr:response regulator [Candidatus Omnitrophota bacterium]
MERYLGTFEVAKFCHVSPGSVFRWIKEGKLQASLTAGGHHRVEVKDLIVFLKTLRISVPAEFADQEKPRMLIVDDEEEFSHMIRWNLEEEFSDILIEETRDGFHAGWQIHEFRPHLVILDLMMPGLDGFHVLEFVRAHSEFSGTKIIAMSALLAPEVKKRVLDLGANDYVGKPFDLEELKERVAFHLGISTKKKVKSDDIKRPKP